MAVTVVEDARAEEPAADPWHHRHRGLAISLAGLGALTATLATLLLTPVTDQRLTVTATAGHTYADAAALAADLLAADDDAVHPRCRSRIHDRGHRADRSVVLLHGYTNCPAQFDVVADAYAAAGYNVVVPRLPGHGSADRLDRSLSQIRAPDLAQAAWTAVDIAAGLGERVTVVGLSGGGTLAGWVAAHHDEVAEAVLLAPLVAPRVLPTATVAPVARLSRLIPDVYLWWDGDLQAQLADPPYAYPRYSLRSIGAFLAVGRAARDSDPGRTTPLQRLVVVSNPGDLAVSNVGVALLGDHLAAQLATDGVHLPHRIAAEAGFGHDLIDPEGENGAVIATVYGELEPLLGLDTLVASLVDPPPTR